MSIPEVDSEFQYGLEALNGIYVNHRAASRCRYRRWLTASSKCRRWSSTIRAVSLGDALVNLAPGTALGQAVSAIQKAAKELGPPLSLQTSFQGNAQAFGASLKSTPILIAAALFVIDLILGILYESLIHPVTILSTLPAAGLGALLLLMAAHYDLSVIAIVGTLLLIGIVKKNGIMLVDFAQEVEHREGLTAEKLIYQACMLRFRPILMTTMAALLGAVPMMLGTGVGSEIRQPLGYAIVGGLAVSQILTPIRHRSFISTSTGCRAGLREEERSKQPPARPLGLTGFSPTDPARAVDKLNLSDVGLACRGMAERCHRGVLASASRSLP